MSIGNKIERARTRLKLADIRRRGRPAERQEELAERQHQHELAKLDASFKTTTREDKRAQRRARRDEKWGRRWARLGAFTTSVGALILGLVGWLSARWLVLRAWIADRIVVVPVLVAGGAALYGQFGYLHDPTTPQFPGDRTGMGWATPVALLAGAAVEVMAFVLFRAAKRGRDVGDDVRVESITGWGIVSGAVWFNFTHVDPLAGFLSAIGPIAWEIRERRERRNREIANGTRGVAPIALPRLSLRFRWHYQDEHTAMIRMALWDRARRSYPSLVARVENQTAAAELTASINRLADLVSANPVRQDTEPGSALVSSRTRLALEPGSAEPGSRSGAAVSTEPGSVAEPGSAAARPASSAGPGSAEPGPRTRSGGVEPGSAAAVQVFVVETGEPGSDPITSYPVFTAPQVGAGFSAAEPGFEPGSDNGNTEPGSDEPGSSGVTAAPGEPGSNGTPAEPGSLADTTINEPGSVPVADDTARIEPGPETQHEPGSAEPGSAAGVAVTSNPVQDAENDLEQTRPMPRLVPDTAEPGSPNPVRRLHAVATDEDADTVRRMIDLSLALIDRERAWVSREDQIAHLRAQGITVTNRRRDAWWAEMRQYREAAKTTKTG